MAAPPRRFPPPWRADRTPHGYVVRRNLQRMTAGAIPVSPSVGLLVTAYLKYGVSGSPWEMDAGSIDARLGNRRRGNASFGGRSFGAREDIRF
jgi:hypothetical protein